MQDLRNTAESITIIQRIATHWTKQSRGAPGAISRNAIPEALRLPLEEWPPGGCTVVDHYSGFDERSGFEDRKSSITFESLEFGRPVRYGAVLVQKEDGRLRVSWDYTSEDAGMPLRPGKKKDVFELAPNRWGRVIYNGRFSGHDDWWYRKTVLNIGSFEKAVASVFVETVPDVVMDKTELLY